MWRISAHAAFAAVAVEHAHAKIRNLAGQNQNQPIRPAAEVLPAHPEAQGRRVIHLFLEAVDIEIVVSGALHLGKAHAVTAFPAFPPSIPHAPAFDHPKAPGSSFAAGRFRLLTKCGVQGDHPLCRGLGQSPKALCRSIFRERCERPKAQSDPQVGVTV